MYVYINIVIHYVKEYKSMATIRKATNPVTEMLTAGMVMHPGELVDEPMYCRSFNPATSEYTPSTFCNKRGVLSRKIVLNTSGTSESHIKQSRKDPLVLNANLRGVDAATMYSNLRDLLLVVPMQCRYNLKLQNMESTFLSDDIRRELQENICAVYKPETAYPKIIELIEEKIGFDNIGFDENAGKFYLRSNENCCITFIPPRNAYKGATLLLNLKDVQGGCQELKPLMETFDILLAFCASEGENVNVTIWDNRTPNTYFQNRVKEYAEYHKENMFEKIKEVLSKRMHSLRTWGDVSCRMSYANKDTECESTLFPRKWTQSDGVVNEWAYYMPEGCAPDTFLDCDRKVKIGLELSKAIGDVAQGLLEVNNAKEKSFEVTDKIHNQDAQNRDNRGVLNTTHGVSLGGGSSVVPVLPV